MRGMGIIPAGIFGACTRPGDGLERMLLAWVKLALGHVPGFPCPFNAVLLRHWLGNIDYIETEKGEV